MKRVEVRWVDTIAINHGWRSPRHYRRAARGAARNMRTSGYLVSESKRAVNIAHSRMVGGGNVDYVMSIPRSQVTRIRQLK